MNPVEMDLLVRRANAAGFTSIADYTAHLEGALREIESWAETRNVLLWTIARAALRGEWKPMRGAFIDSSKEGT